MVTVLWCSVCITQISLLPGAEAMWGAHTHHCYVSSCLDCTRGLWAMYLMNTVKCSEVPQLPSRRGGEWFIFSVVCLFSSWIWSKRGRRLCWPQRLVCEGTAVTGLDTAGVLFVRIVTADVWRGCGRLCFWCPAMMSAGSDFGVERLI